MKHLLPIVLICTTIASNAQFYVGAGAGATAKGKAAAELQLGYVFKFFLLQTGFVTHTNATDPAVFQIKTGHAFKFGRQAVVLTGGYAYHLQSENYKENNSSNYTTGIEYVKFVRDGGALYTGVTRSGEFTFITVGLKYFFARRE